MISISSSGSYSTSRCLLRTSVTQNNYSRTAITTCSIIRVTAAGCGAAATTAAARAATCWRRRKCEREVVDLTPRPTGAGGYLRSGITATRTTGERLVSGKYSDTVNWAKPGLNAKGAPVRDPAKDYDIAGSLISPANGGITNWPPPAFNPQTGLMYVPTQDSYAMYYLTELDPRGAMGLGGKEEITLGTMRSYVSAIDYKTGKTVWKHVYPALGGALGSGMLTTAGGLLFAGDVSGNLIAYDAANGKVLWHAYLTNLVSNAPETYTLDGHQYVLVGAGDTVYSFILQ